MMIAAMTRGCALLLCLVLVPANAGQVYKWVGEDGKVHFSTQPPPDVMDRVEDAGVSDQSSVNIPSAIRGDWRGKDRGRMIRVLVSGYGITVRDAEADYRERYLSGHPLHGRYDLDNGHLVVSSDGYYSSSAGERKYTVTMPDEETLKIAAAYSNEVYRLRKKPAKERILEGREQMLPGLWAEVHFNDHSQLVRKYHFKRGIFTVYKTTLHDRINTMPPEIDTEGYGWWRIEDGDLVMEYWRADSTVDREPFEKIRWKIENLTKDTMTVRSKRGREQRVFLKQRIVR